jgi:hypothetical protein
MKSGLWVWLLSLGELVHDVLWVRTSLLRVCATRGPFGTSGVRGSERVVLPRTQQQPSLQCGAQ